MCGTLNEETLHVLYCFSPIMAFFLFLQDNIAFWEEIFTLIRFYVIAP